MTDHAHRFVDTTPLGSQGHRWKCKDCDAHFGSVGCTTIIGRPHVCPCCGAPCRCECDYCDPVKVYEQLRAYLTPEDA